MNSTNEIHADVSQPRQLSEHGPLLFWHTQADSDRRPGLAINVRACNALNCQCREVTLDVVAVDDRLNAARSEPEGLKLIYGEALEEQSAAQVKNGVVRVHIDTGEIIPERTHAPAELCTWIVNEMDGELLDLFHQRWLQAKNVTRDANAWRALDLSFVRPGIMLAWDQLFPGGRDDVFATDEGLFLAIDYHCIAPGCDCGQVRLVVLDAVAEDREEVGSLLMKVGQGQSIQEIHFDAPLEYHALLNKVLQAYKNRHPAMHNYLWAHYQDVRGIAEQLPPALN